jgi:hypothetical protein
MLSKGPRGADFSDCSSSEDEGDLRPFGPFSPVKVIGQGSFGIVKLCQLSDSIVEGVNAEKHCEGYVSSRKYALKICSKRRLRHIREPGRSGQGIYCKTKKHFPIRLSKRLGSISKRVPVLNPLPSISWSSILPFSKGYSRLAKQPLIVWRPKSMSIPH